jgi:hypothetical protein
MKNLDEKQEQKITEANNKVIAELIMLRWSIKYLSRNCYRVCSRMDIYTQTGKWYDLRTKTRGTAPNRDLGKFLKKFFKLDYAL